MCFCGSSAVYRVWETWHRPVCQAWKQHSSERARSVYCVVMQSESGHQRRRVWTFASVSKQSEIRVLSQETGTVLLWLLLLLHWCCFLSLLGCIRRRRRLIIHSRMAPPPPVWTRWTSEQHLVGIALVRTARRKENQTQQDWFRMSRGLGVTQRIPVHSECRYD